MTIEVAAHDAFKKLVDIWKPIAGGRLIIPFCTPIIERPDVLVIGQNHASFTGNNADLPNNDPIGLEMSEGIPKVNTFIEHNHKFASEVGKFANELSTHVSSKWCGTNACAIQAEGTDFGKNIYSNPLYDEIRKDSAKILRALIREHIQPKNIFLFGKPAIEIYENYFKEIGKGIIHTAPYKDIHLKNENNIRLFALWYPYGKPIPTSSGSKTRIEINKERIRNGELLIK